MPGALYGSFPPVAYHITIYIFRAKMKGSFFSSTLALFENRLFQLLKEDAILNLENKKKFSNSETFFIGIQRLNGFNNKFEILPTEVTTKTERM